MEQCVLWKVLNACQSSGQKMSLKNLEDVPSSSKGWFGLMGQRLVGFLQVARGIVCPVRAALDGILGSPPAGFKLYYAVLMQINVLSFMHTFYFV